MKKVVIFLYAVLFSASTAYSAPCYGTKIPDKYQFFAGAQTYSIFKRYLKNNYGEIRSTQHFVLISFGLTDWLSIDLKGGAGYIKHNIPGADELDYPTFVGGGYGFRIKLFEKNNFKSVFGFQHISIHPYTIEVNNVKHKSVLDDWQFSLLGSYEFSTNLTPYFGVRVSRMDYIHWVDDVRKRKDSDETKNIGIIAGLDIPVTDNVWINLESQTLDCTAFAGSINFKF